MVVGKLCMVGDEGVGLDIECGGSSHPPQNIEHPSIITAFLLVKKTWLNDPWSVECNVEGPGE